MIFANKGWENTPEAARLACDYAREHGIKHVVIASKTGYTTDIFMEHLCQGRCGCPLCECHPLLWRPGPRSV